MTPATQREALAVLADLCALSEDVRLGQLLAHLGFLGEDETGHNLWEIDDDELLSVLYCHREELLRRQRDVPNAAAADAPSTAATHVDQIGRN